MEERAMPQATVAGLSELETSKVLKNTYLLLGMTIAFSAVVAFFSMAVTGRFFVLASFSMASVTSLLARMVLINR